MATDNKRRIFLVDDEPIQNEMLKDYLSERFACDIDTYSNGEDALKNINRQPDIIVLDYHLNANSNKAKNGVEVLKQMKESYPAADVIMLSGQDKIDVAIDSMKYGAYDYVVKGETAFARMENVINKIVELRNAKSMNGVYKRTIALLSVAIGVIILLSLYLYFFTHAYSH